LDNSDFEPIASLAGEEKFSWLGDRISYFVGSGSQYLLTVVFGMGALAAHMSRQPTLNIGLKKFGETENGIDS